MNKYKANSKTVELELTTSIITCLYIKFKKTGHSKSKAELFRLVKKSKTQLYAVIKKCTLNIKTHIRLKVNKCETIFHANSKHKKAYVSWEGHRKL